VADAEEMQLSASSLSSSAGTYRPVSPDGYEDPDGHEEGHEQVTSQDASSGGQDSDLTGSKTEPPPFDISVAHPARIYNYWLGGKDNYAADREAGELAVRANPNILPGVRANRAFLRRAVQFLAGEAGIRQFLDIGTGLPTAENTHEVAQAIAPESRIVYVDNDPIVLVHASALLTSTPEGVTAYVNADAQDTGTILREAAQTLDFSKPIAVMALMILQYVPDSDHPREIVRRLMEAVPPGSYLAISDTTRDIDTERVSGTTAQLNTRMGPARMTLRSRDEIAGFLDGLELVDPGLVPLPQWRATANPAHVIPCYAAVARKP
jgi:S-adenosyl methyltransferase